MTINSNNTIPDPSEIKTEIDNILHKHTIRLLEINPDTVTFSYNLASITCLVLCVEREKEIKSSPDSSIERYTNKTFLDDIAEIGLEIDDTLISALNMLIKNGNISVNSDDSYSPQLPAFALVNFFDNIFPEMRGINFIAYIIQIIDEALSGRKKVDVALDQLDQTLHSKGVFLSQQNAKKTLPKTKTEVKTDKNLQKKSQEPTTKQLLNLRKKNKEQLQKLMELRKKSSEKSIEPAVLLKGKFKNKVNIKEIFPSEKKADDINKKQENITDTKKNDAKHNPLSQEIQHASNESDISNSISQEYSKSEITDIDIDIATDVEKTKDNINEIISDNSIKIGNQKAETVAQNEPIQEPESNNVEIDTELQEEAENSPKSSDERIQKETILSEDLIQKQIEDFQSNMKMACPVCETGKISSQKTEKGKNYYYCSNSDCNFVSWNKPSIFKCPLCSHPFLIEFADSTNQIGLQCPSSNCHFKQNGLTDPSVQTHTTTTNSYHKTDEKNTAPKKRKIKVVRKKRIVRKNR